MKEEHIHENWKSLLIFLLVIATIFVFVSGDGGNCDGGFCW